MRALLCSCAALAIVAAPVAAQAPDDALVEDPQAAETSPNEDAPTEPTRDDDDVVPDPPAPVAAVAEEPDEPSPATVQLEWGSGLTVRSDDGNFTLQIRSRIQAQVAFESARPGDAEPDIQLLVRRARVVFLGNLGAPSLQYYVQLGLSPRDMEPDLLIPLRDAVITWNALRDLAIRVGQMKVPFNRERVISSSALQLVDRSIVNAELTLDRDMGVQLFSTDLFGLGEVLGYQLGIFGGDGRLRINEGTGLLYVARLQAQPLGAFEDSYVEADHAREERARLSIGVGVAWNQESRRTLSTHGGHLQLPGGFDYASFEADLIFKYAGFSLMAEVIYREATGASERTGEVEGVLVTERARNAIGWMVQAGYIFSAEVPVELAARFADIHPIGAITAVTPLREMTLGLNYYPIRHDLKIQLDYSYLAPERFEDGHHRIRLQAQAFF